MRVVLFQVRGCPAGWLGLYGNEWVVTPQLDRLAVDSVVFDRHISDSPHPDAADAVWLGTNRPCGLLATLRQRGVKSFLVRANHPETDRPDWFYAGWDEVFDFRPQQEDDSPLDALVNGFPDLLRRLVAVPEFLLWVEVDRLLPPWEVPQKVFEAYLLEGDDEPPVEPEERPGSPPKEAEQTEKEEEQQEPGPTERTDAEAIPPWCDPPTGPFDNSDPEACAWLQASFAAVVTALDVELGKLFETLRENRFDESAAWLVTSDHGYPLGEHGQIGLYRPWLHQELVHLPLLLRLPGAVGAGRRVYAFTQPADAAATVLDLFGCEPAEGHSLLPLTRGRAEGTRDYAISRLELNGAAEQAIRTDDWALLWPLRVPEGETRAPLLFAKPDDRWEVNNLYARNIERADELAAELRKALGPAPGAAGGA